MVWSTSCGASFLGVDENEMFVIESESNLGHLQSIVYKNDGKMVDQLQVDWPM